jgi:hypothetical protein
MTLIKYFDWFYICASYSCLWNFEIPREKNIYLVKERSSIIFKVNCYLYILSKMRTSTIWDVPFLSMFIVIWHRHVPIDCPLYATICCVRSQLLILSYILAPCPVCILSLFTIRQFFFVSWFISVASTNEQSQSKKNRAVKGNIRRRSEREGKKKKYMVVHILP